MTVVFTLTKSDRWRFHPNAKHRKPLTIGLRLASPPLFFVLLTYFAGAGPVGILTALLLGALLPLIAFGLMLSDMRRDVRLGMANVKECIAEVGKFDFRWGTPAKAGYYYHWSYFAGVTEGPDCLKFTLHSGREFLVPRSAFENGAEAARFASLAQARWEAARTNARYEAVVSEGVWPPPPRPRA